MKKTMLTIAALAIWVATPATAQQMGGEMPQGSTGGDPLDINTGAAKSGDAKTSTNKAGSGAGSDSAGEVPAAIQDEGVVDESIQAAPGHSLAPEDLDGTASEPPEPEAQSATGEPSN